MSNDIIFLLPSDYFKPNNPDEMFKEQAEAFKAVGFECIYTDIDQLADMATLSVDLSGKQVLYRGWMLNAASYTKLCQVVENSNGEMFTSIDKYLLAHHLPNWYPLIKDYTAETVVLDSDVDLKKQLLMLGWGQYFIKDYVKSLKTSIGSIIKDINEIDTVVEDMEKFRGTIEGGICVRRVENFLNETEQRFFIVNNRPYSAVVDQPIPGIVLHCAENIDHKFYSIDLIKKSDGKDMIVEIGDGQVSDYVGWKLDRFVSVVTEAVRTTR